MRKKVSFDFDGTLEHEHVQDYAKSLIENGVEVWVVTTRFDENHIHLYYTDEWRKAGQDDLWKVVDKLTIPRHHVRFTNMEWKAKYLDKSSFIWHLDDNDEEHEQAELLGINVPIIDVKSSFWKNECNSYLNL